MINRLQVIKSPETGKLWDALFEDGNELANLTSALSHSYLLYPMAGADPRRVVECIQEGFKNPNEQLRSRISGARIALNDTIRDLLFRKETCYAAVHCLVSLAIYETDTKNDGTATTLSDFFYPHHPQVHLPLDSRLELLTDLCAPEKTDSSRQIGIKTAALTASNASGSAFFVFIPVNGMPFDARAYVTYPDIATYLEKINHLLIDVVRQEDPSLAKLARDTLPQGVANLCVQSGLIPGIKQFGTLVEWASSDEQPISVSELYRWIRHVHTRLTEDTAKMNEEESAKFKVYTQQLRELLNAIEQGSFFVRLQLWAGRTFDNYEIAEDGAIINRARNELCLLAREAVENPALFTDRVERWLLSEEAKNAYLFFQCLGEHDTAHHFLEKIEHIGIMEANRPLVGYYFEGLTHSDRQFVLDYLDDLNKKGGEKKNALSDVVSIAALSSNQVEVTQIEELVKNRKVNLGYVAQIVFTKEHLTQLDDNIYLMLERIAGPDFRGGAIIVSMLATVISKDEPLDFRLTELLWRCLEARSKATRDDSYDFDRVASILAHIDIERAFKLLERLLEQPSRRDSWGPTSIWGDHQFWNVLQSKDRSRALCIVLKAISQGCVDFLSVKSLIDQDEDASVLLDFAAESLEQAIAVCECLTIEKKSFWDIAFKVIKLHPESGEIRNALTDYSDFGEGWPPTQDEIKSRCKEIARRQNDPKTPYVAQQWLSQLADYLCVRVEKMRRNVI